MRNGETGMRVALLNSDEQSSQLICQLVRTAGHECHGFKESQSLMLRLRRDVFDLAIVCDSSAGIDRAELLLWMHQHVQERMPVLIISDSSDERDVVHALTHGADDYLANPIRPKEFVARIQVLLRRNFAQSKQERCLSYGRYAFYPDSHAVTIAGETVEVTNKEFELALIFFMNQGRVLSRPYLHDMI